MVEQYLSDLSGVAVGGLSVYLMWKLASNHIEHNTSAINKLKEAIDNLLNYINVNHGK